jgi:anti-repressor protein
MKNNLVESNILEMFGDYPIRTGISEDGQPLFVARDIATALGISQKRKFIKDLDEDSRCTLLVHTRSQRYHMTGVNEFGVYELILKSNKPKAKAFKKWITHEILPSLRKQGFYNTPEYQRLLERDKTLTQLEKPKPVRSLARLGYEFISKNRFSTLKEFYQTMREAGYLTAEWSVDWNKPTYKATELGILTLGMIENQDGENYLGAKVTQYGEMYLRHKYLKGE